jgi:hypothetical protein
MYLPLNFGGQPSFAEALDLLRAHPIHPGELPLVDVVETLRGLSERFDVPVLFTEAGSQSRVGAMANPPFTTGGLDFFEQSAIYAALLQTFSGRDWFEGINWWNNDHPFKDPPGTDGWRDFWFDLHLPEFGFLEKQSGDILRAFWCDGASFGPISGEIVLGGDGPDRLVGTARADLLSGGVEDDALIGRRGADRIFAGDGADVAKGGAGDDLVFGGSSFRDQGDFLIGGGGRDRVYGGAGRDVLNGQGGHDRLFGGDGADRLIAGSGNDRLVGGAGNDRLLAGAGKNLLFGGVGSDSFILQPGSGRDRLADVDLDLDRIDLSAIAESRSDVTVTAAGGGRHSLLTVSETGGVLLLNITPAEVRSHWDEFVSL